MKKFISCLAVVALAITMMLPTASANNVKAEENTHITQAEQNIYGLNPYAWYKFDSEEALGKDVMGHFDLVKKINGSGSITILEDTDGSKYAAFRRKELEPPLSNYHGETATPSNVGAVLYAPNLDRSGLDMSDLIPDSFTVSLTLRAPYHPADYGAMYCFSTGRYNDSISITPWLSGVEIQPYTRFVMGKDADQPTIDGYKVDYLADRTQWMTVTIVGDSAAKEVRTYINGVHAGTENVEVVKFSNQNMNGALGADYGFSIGAQSAIGGSGFEGHADADFKECLVFDYALSETNVAALYNGETTEYAGDYIASVPELDTSAIDLQLTDVNTLADVMAKMPTSVRVEYSDGGKGTADVYWTSLGSTNTIYGVITGDVANTKGYMYEYKLDTVVKILFNNEHVRITDLKLGGRKIEDPSQTIILTEEEAGKSLALQFKLEEVEGSTIKSVILDGVDEFMRDAWEGDDEGYIYLRVKFGAEVTIVTSGPATPGPGTSEEPTPGPTTSENQGGNSTQQGGEQEKGGCKGFIGFECAALLFVGVAVVMKKRFVK